jgi:glycine dehydrogenase
MAKYAGFESMDALIDATVPTDIRLSKEMDMGKWTQPLSESEFLSTMKTMANKNKVFKSYQAGLDAQRTAVFYRGVTQPQPNP